MLTLTMTNTPKKHKHTNDILPGGDKDGTYNSKEGAPPPVETGCEGVLPLGGSQALNMI